MADNDADRGTLPTTEWPRRVGDGTGLADTSMTSGGTVSRQSGYKRERRNAQKERLAEIERAWRGSIPADVAASFDAQVLAAKARGPLPPPPDMAPGTPPRPPRPGHEPKPPKTDERPRRGR